MVLVSCGVKSTETDSVASIRDSLALGDSASGFDENNYESFLDLSNYLVDDNTTKADVQIIDSAAVVIINPTEEQIQEMEEKYGEDFFTIADDNSYYQADALMRLDSIKIRTVNAESRYLKLQGDSESWVLDIRKVGAPEWNMILFRRDKKPEIISAIDVTREKITEYFSY